MSEPFIPPPGAMQFQPNMTCEGNAVAVWISEKPSPFHCSMCHGPVHSIYRETLPAKWATGPSGYAPLICVTESCKVGGRIIE
jgi:hypothetical protein